MDMNRAIKVAVSTGKVSFGAENVRKNAAKGAMRLIIVAANFPDEKFMGKTYSNVPIYHFPGTGIELGNVCGKPFPVSVLAVYEPGARRFWL